MHRVTVSGGAVIGELSELLPTVFRIQWPKEISKDLVLFKNPAGKINNSDLEMAGLLFLWLCVEAIAPDLAHKHIALFSYNSPTVSWLNKMALQKSCIAAQLVRAFALCLNVQKTCPLTPVHIPGMGNALTDIPSQSFGRVKEWECKTGSDLLILFIQKFPLLHQASWTVFQFGTGMTTRVISALQMRGITLAEWQQLPKIERHIGAIGPSMSDLWGWTLSYRGCSTQKKCVSSRGSQQESAGASTGEESGSRLEQPLTLSRPLDRRPHWPVGKTPQK
jgi:hypothetical protein